MEPLYEGGGKRKSPLSPFSLSSFLHFWPERGGIIFGIFGGPAASIAPAVRSLRTKNFLKKP